MIKRLQYFNAVVETGSISETSRVFDVQPSSVSRQLAALEEELGVRLINRNTRTVSLTEAGLAGRLMICKISPRGNWWSAQQLVMAKR